MLIQTSATVTVNDKDNSINIKFYINSTMAHEKISVNCITVEECDNQYKLVV